MAGSPTAAPRVARALGWLKGQPVLLAAAAAALLSMAAVPPSPAYAAYFDWHTLLCLFSLLAVLNALRLTHGIQTLKARDILNETLLSLAGKPGALRAVLEQDTDYMQLVDDMIQARQQRYPLLVEKPFAEGEAVSPDALWEACREWLAPGEGRCILFRFLRHLTPETPPMNRHWTCADRMDGDLLHLFDCSHEDEAVTLIPRESFVTRSADVQRERLLVIQPNSLRFLALPWRVHAF